MANNWNISSTAATIHRDALVWDSHGCMPQNLQRLPLFMDQLSQYRDSGVNIAHINIGDAYHELDSLVRMTAFMRNWIRQHPQQYRLALTVDDIEAARANGQLAVAFDIEGGHAVQHQISLLEMFYDLGVRWMLLSYNKTNMLAGGCHDEDPGLSDLGRAFIDEMARLGMITCCTHAGYRTAMDVFEYASNPVIFSHSNPRAITDHPRNVPDELMRACAATGGVQCINGIGLFLGGDTSDPETVFRHIDYTCELIGPDHVGIGLDYVFDTVGRDNDDKEFDPIAYSDYWPPEHYPADMTLSESTLFGPRKMPQLTQCMLDHGYSEENIRAILGGNMMRVARQVWK